MTIISIKLLTTLAVVARPTPSAPPPEFIPSKQDITHIIMANIMLLISPVDISLSIIGSYVIFIYIACVILSFPTPIKYPPIMPKKSAKTVSSGTITISAKKRGTIRY